MIEHFVVVAKVGHKEVDEAIVLVVACSNAHRGNLAPILVQREPRDVALIVECAVTLIDVEKIWLRVVAHNKIRFAVAIDVDKDRSESVITELVVHACFHGYIGKRSVRSEEHTSELQSPCNLVCRLLL